jgi:hypothetical protein
MKPWVQYLLAFIIFCHGFIYLRIGSLLPGAVKGWNGSSWLLGDLVGGGHLNTLTVVVHVLAGLLIMCAAVAFAFPATFPGVWVPFAVGGSIAGIAAFAVFWDGQTMLFFEEGGIGALVSAVLVAFAIVFRHTSG